MEKMTEADFASCIVDHLTDLKWDVYQEVQVKHGSGVADVVARQGPLVWVIETKTKMGLAVMEQAARWTPYAHLVSVAVPKCHNRFAKDILNRFGIGLLVGNKNNIREAERPYLNRKAHVRAIMDSLSDRQKTYARAGNAEGRRWTPFQNTCEHLEQLVRKRPGLMLKEAIAEIRHHYASPSTAIHCLRQWIQAGIVKGIKIEDGRLWVK